MKGIHERYKGLKRLPKNIPSDKVFTVYEYAQKRKVTTGAIYVTIDRVKAKLLCWNEFICYQHRNKIRVVET